MLGFDPRTVDKMMLVEFTACFDGYKIANGIKPKSNATISEDRLKEMGIEGF